MSERGKKNIIKQRNYGTPIEDSSKIAEKMDASKVNRISVFVFVLEPTEALVKTSVPMAANKCALHSSNFIVNQSKM